MAEDTPVPDGPSFGEILSQFEQQQYDAHDLDQAKQNELRHIRLES